MGVNLLSKMPEDAQTSLSLPELLNEIEDPEFNSKSKLLRLKSLLSILQSGRIPSQQQVVRILQFCTDVDISCVVCAVAIISAIVKNEEISKTIDVDTLIPPGLFLLKLLRIVNALSIKSMTIQTFLALPQSVLIKIVTVYSTQVFDTIDADSGNSDLRQKMEVYQLLKILDYLPPPNAKSFVKQGLTIWLTKVIPRIINFMLLDVDEDVKLEYIKSLETLMEPLVTTDYVEHSQWKVLLECICKEYPTIIKTLLDQGSDIWHRLWIVIINLLNIHITKNISGLGTPINSLLPVVENAFKLTPLQRIRAFQCWNKLIDNFADEINDHCIAKRIKLLLIPLKLNNARTEEIALAKFDTWWHFIRKFESRVEKFADDVLISFLHFVFGKCGAKPGFTLIQLSERLKKKSLEALVEIIGHKDCKCSVDIPKLNNKIVNIKILVNNWNDWLHFLETVFRLAGTAGVYELSTKNYVNCVWNGMVRLIADLPDNTVRRDLFMEMLRLIHKILKEQNISHNCQDVILNAIISSLFNGNEKMEALLVSKSEDYKPLSLIIKALLSSSTDGYFERHTETEQLNLFKPVAMSVLRQTSTVNKLSVFDSFKPNDKLLLFWTALMDNLTELDSNVSAELLLNLMEWPLMNLDCFNQVKTAAMKWYTICNLMYQKLSSTGFNKEISKYIVPKGDSMNYFIICVTIALLKQRVLNGESPGVMSTMLRNFTSSIKEYDDFCDVIPLSVDTVVLILNTAIENKEFELADTAVICAKNLLKVLIFAIDKKSNNNEVTNDLYIQLNNLNEAVKPLLKLQSYTDNALQIIEELSTNLRKIKKESQLYSSTISTMKMYMSGVIDETVKDKINKAIESASEENLKNQTNNKMMELVKIKEFTSPDMKKVKKEMIIEPNIVKKVDEDGEEYVVVKSNWKFNPKKLTENQKEKFQRKREDIPALYQDLSQSQDEFKLTAWKTESQDTTNTSSNSKSINSKPVNAEDTTSILKTIPSTDVLPKIMKNILHKNDQKDDAPRINGIESLTDKGNKKALLTPPAKTKSPRMALKDRVFRNMKNLLEKSTPPKDKPEIRPLIHTENIPGTPVNKPESDIKIINSAPPTLIADRPSRVKRKPKKFEDSELFALRKSRHSHSGMPQTDSQSDSQDDLPSVMNNEISDGSNGIISTDSCQQNDDKVGNYDNIEGIEPLNKIDDVTENNIEHVQSNTNGDSTNVNAEVIVNNALEEKVPEVETTASVTDEDCVCVIVISESEPNTEPKEVVDTVEKQTVVTTTTNTQNENDKIENVPVTPAANSKKVPPKSSTKKSRIEKELAIDMVEGHPLFKRNQSEKRTRKKIIESLSIGKRKSVPDKLNKSKLDATPKSSRKTKDKKTANTQLSVTVDETQENSQSPVTVTEGEPPCSEDVIESSQDSTITTISVKSSKRTSKRQPVIALERINVSTANETQDLLQNSEFVLESNTIDIENKDDTVFPQNKTVDNNNQSELTENMDTEPMEDKDITEILITISNEKEPPLTNNSEVVIGPETLELAEADTQPNNTADFMEFETTDAQIVNHSVPIESDLDRTQVNTVENIENISEIDLTKDSPLPVDSIADPDTTKELSSPCKDKDKRKQDFLNNTIEISPIKVQSPDRDKKSPSPETSSDFVVIKLSSPVHSNGEPFEKPSSPEFFAEYRLSPDKRDVSPPRTEINTANNTSPSSSLSLKKNKLQVRPGGRAAHMLGLCVPDKLNTLKMTERPDPEEGKKVSTPARRNLRILYNTAGDVQPNENEDNENFLKLKRSLPSVDSSPAGPILKRKLSEIADEATVSPASKRKRVSFHDPPVSTTISVHKYIEPLGLRSPQNSAQKRLERQNRQTYSKSPKRLDNVFKLETVLSKALESFTDEPTPLSINTPEETQTSLEVTPTIEIIKTSELNDTDPICPELVKCEDSICVLAAKLSSPSMKYFFVKEVEDKVKTVGDLAKMTEVDVCRLCIKAPKVKVAKKVLSDYVSKRKESEKCADIGMTVDLPVINDNQSEVNTSSVEIQTVEVSQCDMEVQTSVQCVAVNSTQTDEPSVICTYVQTDESGSQSTTDVINKCLAEREDFVDTLAEILDLTNIRKISKKLSSNHIFDSLMANQKSTYVLDKVLKKESYDVPKEEKANKELTYLTEFMSQRFGSKDLILFCSKLLQKVHDKPA